MPTEFGMFSPEMLAAADFMDDALHEGDEQAVGPRADIQEVAQAQPSVPQVPEPAATTTMETQSLPAKRPHHALPAKQAGSRSPRSAPQPLHAQQARQASSKSKAQTHSVLLTHFVLDTLREISKPRDDWDGSPDVNYGPPCCAFRCLAAKLEDVEVSSDSSDDDGGPLKAGLSRQERKAIDREIPWRKLMSDYPTDVISLYAQANIKEYDVLGINQTSSCRRSSQDQIRSCSEEADNALPQCIQRQTSRRWP